MGDALATYVEARACQRSEVTSRAGGNTTGAAMALAELCFDTLMEVAKAACAERGYTSQYAIYKLHRRVYLQRLRQQMRMADIILERNKRSIIFFVQK